MKSMKDSELKNMLTQAFREGREGMAESCTVESGAGKAGQTPGYRKVSRRTWLVSAAAILAVVVLGLGGFQAWRGYTIHQMAMEETVRYLEDLLART